MTLQRIQARARTLLSQRVVGSLGSWARWARGLAWLPKGAQLERASSAPAEELPVCVLAARRRRGKLLASAHLDALFVVLQSRCRRGVEIAVELVLTRRGAHLSGHETVANADHSGLCPLGCARRAGPGAAPQAWHAASVRRGLPARNCELRRLSRKTRP